MLPKTARALFIRLWRVGLLVAAVLVIRDAVQTRERLEAAAALTPERLRDFFPDIDHLGEPNPSNGWRTAFDRRDRSLGYVTTTAPESDKIIGYSGPSHCLLVFDMKGLVTGVRLLKSYDTTEHVAEVVADRKFFTQFKAMKPGGEIPEKLHAVTGATLTSAAITQGVLAKLGRASGTSLRFPEEITVEEVTRLEPAAKRLEISKQHPGGWDVLDEAGKKLAIAVRTSPVADSIVGYKGPTDTLMLLDATGTTLKRIAIRKSYETKRYLAYVTGDDYFLNLFNEKTLEKLADIDFKEAKVEGVSGATETSWSVAESLKRRAQNLLEAKPSGWLRQIRWRWQDTGHVVVIISALLMAFTHLRGISWMRHLHHLLLVLYGGFMAGELLSQGLLTGWAAHGTPWKSAPGFLILAAFALLGPVFTSKHLYCHHICAHGALQQLLARRLKVRWHVSPRLERVLTTLPFVLLALVLVSVVLGWSVDLNSLEPFDAYVFRIAGWATLTIAVVGLIASLFQPLAYCKYGCPTGALFKLLRFTGDGDRLGLKDWLAAGLLALAFLV
ncbi:FMN-binding protein [Brevifollis gellanilyticus]|uniref:NosR regulatory protein n=1 Tax=Brevifollis gellanilyticus TaxID=748831 RepID=A0A512M251_9BACT|nr:FMN-binding protein [Brevifollis gellanilyticus]GEP40805.1 NosR regulatory protein [Brevifollis gellanilyticus]